MGERGFLLLSSVAKVGFSPFHLPSALPTTLSIRRSTFSTHGGVCRLDRDQVRSPDLIDLEYADLNLKEKVAETVGHIRIRQHVNPLNSSLMVISMPNRSSFF
ncbi:hypothetical protein MRB53_034602 [Persea americana]|uniref:Uncharacterized protein n=1 Tax=Persea americana TaxID=3435 RepID=A0ACC2K298_PERAE|nr:hypothetical protein MRB53_034602 [Persea americana]